MKKIDTAASKGFRIASRLIGYIGIGLSLLVFVLCYAMPNGFWCMDTGYALDLPGMESWTRLDLPANENNLILLGVIAGAILLIAIIFRIISACSKVTVAEAVANECTKTVKEATKEAAKEVDKAVAEADKKSGKIREYLDGKAKEIIPEDKMPYVEKAGDFLKKHSTVIITSAATVASIMVLANMKESRRRKAERRKFLRNLM